jgi:hypothetical protein
MNTICFANIVFCINLSFTFCYFLFLVYIINLSIILVSIGLNNKINYVFN